MALPVNGSTHLIPALLLICRPRKDERLSWPSWLTCSGWFTHIIGHPSAAGRAQDRESSPARDRRSTTEPRHQLRQRRNDRVSFASPSCRLLAMQSRVYETVRCLSVCLPPARRAHSNKPAAVGACCCGPGGGQEISIDCCSSGGRMRAVARCQRA